MCRAEHESARPNRTHATNLLAVWLLLLLTPLGCAHVDRASATKSSTVAAAPASAACSREFAPVARERPEQTVLDAYRREGAAWLGSLALLLNEEFDMGLAMSLEGGLGAGLAAAQRRENNLRKAVLLGELALEQASQARLAQLRCCGLDVYFLLWGREEATLEMVVDVKRDARASHIVTGPSLSLRSAASASELTRAAAQLLGNVACSGQS